MQVAIDRCRPPAQTSFLDPLCIAVLACLGLRNPAALFSMLCLRLGQCDRPRAAGESISYGADTLMYPKEFRYSKEHQWVRVDDSLGTIGITEHAQKELSEVIYAELPKVGDRVTAGEPMGTVESVKATSEIFSPVTGEVTAVNPILLSNPQMINADPHGEAWLVQVRLSDPSEIAKLISADEYEKLVQQEEAL